MSVPLPSLACFVPCLIFHGIYFILRPPFLSLKYGQKGHSPSLFKQMKHRGWKEERNKKGKRKRSENFVMESRRKRQRKRKWAFRKRMQLGKNLLGGKIKRQDVYCIWRHTLNLPSSKSLSLSFSSPPSFVLEGSVQMEKAAVLCNEMGTRKAALLSMAVYFLSYFTASFRATQFT